MPKEEKVKEVVSKLFSKYSALANKDAEAEKKAEEFIRAVFEALGWDWLSNEVTPQKKVRGPKGTGRVDYSFRKTGQIRTDFYVEIKRFSNRLENPDHIKQVLEYGKNGGIRWVVLTNFAKWRVFNSDYFDEPDRAEAFEFDLAGISSNPEYMNWLLLFSHEKAGTALDEYAKAHKRWKESESIEDLLTGELYNARKVLGEAIVEQNHDLFDTTHADDVSVDACVQHILDRLIFCRMLEDNGADPERKMHDIYDKWQSDKRVQFYSDCLAPFWDGKMRQKYDSTIFEPHRATALRIKNDDFLPIFESFYSNPKTGLRYRFEAIGTDILGHAYENYLSYKVKQTAKRTGLEPELYKRKQSGIYYTPEFLVDHLVRSTLGQLLSKCKTPQETLKIRVLDPACGSGTFLVRAFEEFKAWHQHYQKNGGASPSSDSEADERETSDYLRRVLETCIYGIDIDPRAVQLAKLNLFLRVVETPKQLPKLNIIEKNSLISDGDYPKAFSMESHFPLVAEAGGFDVVLGNPPWERWELKSQEFFEPYDPGFRDLTKQKAEKRMEELLHTRPYLRREWLNKQNEYAMLTEIYNRNFSFQVDGARKRMSGHADLYKLFTERAYQLLKPKGLCGFLVPSGIYTDLGGKGLRKMLFDHCQLTGLYSFENRGHAIFPDVHASYKFVLLTFKKGGKTESFPCAFFLYTAEDLQAAIKNPTIMSVEFIRKSSPNAHSILEIKSGRDNDIVLKLLEFPKLGEKPWELKPFQGFNMTTDSHLFKTGKLGVPLLEGKNIHQFTHSWKEAPVTRYTVLQKDVEKNLKPDKQYQTAYWIGYRLIASSTNERTLIATIVPPGYVCGHSMAVIMLPDFKKMAFLVGVLNSFVLDYLLRQKMSANINFNFFLELPVPEPKGAQADAIIRKVVQLVATTNEFDELKKEIGVKQGLEGENERALAKAQLDVMVAKLYGITKEELAYILEKFPIVDEKVKKMMLDEY